MLDCSQYLRPAIASDRDSDIPNSPGLEVGRCAGQNSGGGVKARLGAVHDPLGDRREGTASCISVWPSQSVLLPGCSYEVL